jgi:biotin transport system substrate-specific component
MTTAALVAALIAGTAWVTVRVGPVPFTLQSMFVLLAGLLLRPGWAAASMGIYLLLGAVGLPVFSGGQGGLGALMGPTGGFLFAFPLAAAVLSAVRGLSAKASSFTTRRVVGDIEGIVVAELLVYLVGIPWLMASTGMDVGKALAVAVVPFLLPDAAKAVMAIVVAGAVRRARGHG